MTNTNRAPGRSVGKMTAVVVLVIIAVLAVIAAIMYFTEPARSLPGILGAITHPAARAAAHRTMRGGAALAVGVVCLAAAGLAGRRGRLSPQ